MTRPGRADLLTGGAAVGLLALASVVGGALYLAGRPVQASSAPLTAHWLPHVGPGTPAALAVAAAVVHFGPRLAGALSWRRLMAAAYGTAVAWILSLALVDGWQRGLAGRLVTKDEYLSEVDGVTDLGAMVDGFAGRILAYQPDSWTTHVSGHPPGAFGVFVGLDRIGLGGGAWAALVCVAVGAAVAVAVPSTLRLLGDENAARAAVPFVVLFPGAVWIGASADGLFAGVTATGVALLAHAIIRRRLWTGAAAGALLAFGLYLSYGLVLIGIPALVVLFVARRAQPRPWRTVGVVAVAGAGVVAAFTAAGFWWLDGYHLVVERYYQGVASERPYAYWVWANLALVVAGAGPVAAVILRRAALTIRSGPVALLPLAGLAAILFADLSGLSKAEVERIWLPFTVWLMAGAALLPPATRRGWLVAQAVTALLINHLLLTSW